MESTRTMVEVSITEAGASFVNQYNENLDKEMEKRFGSGFNMPPMKFGDKIQLTKEMLLMLQTTVFLAVPSGAVVVDREWEEEY